MVVCMCVCIGMRMLLCIRKKNRFVNGHCKTLNTDYINTDCQRPC